MTEPDPVPDAPPRLAAVAPGVVPVLPAGTMNGVTVEAHLEVAAATGHELVSLRPRHVRAWSAIGSEHTTDALVARLGALGLGVAELDPVTGWDDPRRWPTVELPGDVLDDLDLAAAVGARAVTALVMPGEPWDPEAGVDGLGLLASAAAERGLTVQVEPFAWSALWDIVEASEVVARCGAPNAGVLVDNWHLQRRGGTVATLDAVPVESVVGVQISDAVAIEGLPADALAADSSNRLFPGDPDGGLRPEAVLGSLLRRGWTGPVAIEVFGGEPTDPLKRARRAADSLHAVVTAAASPERTIDG